MLFGRSCRKGCKAANRDKRGEETSGEETSAAICGSNYVDLLYVEYRTVFLYETANTALGMERGCEHLSTR